MSESGYEEDMNPVGAREWRSFWSLIGMQTMNAFNDNFAKFLLIPLGVALYELGFAFAGVEHAFAALLVLPFILFAPSAGWLGDRFAKNRVIRWSSWFQIVIMLSLSAALWYGENYGGQFPILALIMTMVVFFGLGSQSALLSPAKMGVVKELVGSRKLGFANGVLEGTVILGILFGQIIGGLWFDKGLEAGKGPWMAALVPILWILIGAIVSLLLSYQIQFTEPKGRAKYSAAIAFRHFGDLAKLRSQKGLWRATLGISFFWSFGGFIQLVIIQIAKELTGGGVGMGSLTAYLWSSVVVGIVLGSLVVSFMTRNRNELGLIVVGGAVMALATILLALGSGAGLDRFFALGTAGFGGAMFLVPLNAYLQDGAPEGERGLVISASNLCINLGGAFAVGFQLLLSLSGVPIWLQFVIIAIACIVVTIYVARLLPRDFVRLIALGIFKFFYRVRGLGVENVPQKGGVLLVANHLSYIDGIVLSIACPRPIRFLMFDTCFEKPWIGKFARLFEMVPVSPAKAKDAIRVAADALEEGAVVCIFPEGQLSRSGGLAEIKRGYEMIARKSGAPVVAAYMDGLWGSMWSFEGSKFLGKGPRKIPFGVSVAFSEPHTGRFDLALELHRLSTETVHDRAMLMKSARSAEPEVLTDLPRGWSAMLEKAWAEDETGFQMRANALQLNQVNLGSRKDHILVEWNEKAEECGILGILWPQLIDAKVAFSEGGETEVLSIVSRECIDLVILRHANSSLQEKLREKGVSTLVLEGESEGALRTGLVRQGRVLSYSIDHPDYETTTMMPQKGWQKNSFGKLLPGFVVVEGEGGLVVSGPALPEEETLGEVAFTSESFLARKSASC
ncbi:MAG: MFS transporter [Akkermansiaceae bacterium]